MPPATCSTPTNPSTTASRMRPTACGSLAAVSAQAAPPGDCREPGLRAGPPRLLCSLTSPAPSPPRSAHHQVCGAGQHPAHRLPHRAQGAGQLVSRCHTTHRSVAHEPLRHPPNRLTPAQSPPRLLSLPPAASPAIPPPGPATSHAASCRCGAAAATALPSSLATQHGSDVVWKPCAASTGPGSHGSHP